MLVSYIEQEEISSLNSLMSLVFWRSKPKCPYVLIKFVLIKYVYSAFIVLIAYPCVPIKKQ